MSIVPNFLSSLFQSTTPNTPVLSAKGRPQTQITPKQARNLAQQAYLNKLGTQMQKEAIAKQYNWKQKQVMAEIPQAVKARETKRLNQQVAAASGSAVARLKNFNRRAAKFEKPGLPKKTMSMPNLFRK